MHESVPYQGQRAVRLGGRLIGLAAVLSLTGCGPEEGLGHVEGVVRLDGQPLTTGTVRFIPEAGRAAEGAIGPDGTFTLGTYKESDGAVVGWHRVVVVAYEMASVERTSGGPPRQRSGAKPLVPERYMSPDTSGLTYEVKPGLNQPTLELTSDPNNRPQNEL